MKILGTAVNGVKMSTNLIGAPSFAQVNPYGLYNHFKSDDYASAYPNIRAISNEYMKIRPFAIDNNGKPVDHPSLNALYHPNKKDSSVMFAEKVAVSTLALPMTYILVWRREGGVAKPGGDFGVKGMNIAGYTFLENPAISIVDKKIHYSIGSQTFTEDEVMALPGGVTPNDLYAGYSPTIASKRWATLDSYIADYQKGFFENGAIPAGMFVITAATNQDFEDTKKTMQEKHRGAGNNNNVSYVPRPVGQDGKPADSKVEWVPFAQSNKDIDFEPLLKHVDNRLSESYGVSSIVKGIDSNAKYSNAEVSENGFAKRAVDPLALRNYTQITHELNRITGGLGVAITYKYEIPAISDQDKVRSETKNIESQVILKMVEAGYSLESIVEAFDLPDRYKLLKINNTVAVIDNDKPDVDDGDEVDDSPDPTEIDGVSPLNRVADKKPVNEAANAINPKAEVTDQQKLEVVARSYMQSQVDRAVSEYSDTPLNEVQPEPTESEREIFVDDMLKIIVGILVASGDLQYEEGIALVAAAGIDTSSLQGFNLSDTARDNYRAYLKRVATTYGADTADSIRGVLAQSNEFGWTRTETENALRNIMNTDQYRIDRLARTELNRSQGMGSIESMKQITAETGEQYEKSLTHPSGAECQWCKALEGEWFALDNPIIGEGASIIGVDGGILVNDFVSNDGWDPHPNGKGVLIYRRSSQ
jgi:phage portal protein BeeE